MLAALVLAAVAIGNALLLVFLLGGWFVEAIYASPGFPAPDIALDDETRRRLAAEGMAAIRPLGPGVDLLREARLPGGEPAFNAREIVHMEDVRGVVAGFAIAWAVGLALAGLGLGAWHRGRARAKSAFADASLVLIALIVVIGLALLVAFDPIFEGFHAIFFTGDSWRFASTDTLLQLYPEMFWAAAGTAIVLLVVAQCLLLRRLLR